MAWEWTEVICSKCVANDFKITEIDFETLSPHQTGYSVVFCWTLMKKKA